MKNEPSSVIAIRFQKLSKLYYFAAPKQQNIEVGDYVVVETSRGREIGHVSALVRDPGKVPKGGWKPIERLATAQDLVMSRIWKRRGLSALIDCREKAAEIGIHGCKFAKAEYAFDGSRLTFFYSSEGEEKADLRPLRQALKRSFRNTRLELRKIGPRDVARAFSGLGACGMAERCCSRFLDEFSPISIKMAKAQGVSLNPQEITGMCGRLRCCLIYEFEQYVEAKKDLPKLKKRVMTPQGVGRVVSILALKSSVVVQLEEGNRVEFLKDEIEPFEELEALKGKAGGSCGNGKDGACSC